MKKHWREGKKGLKTEMKRINILILAFFLSNNIYSQVPINGFCRYNSFNVSRDFNYLFALNYNNDSYTDLVLFNPDTNKIISLTGEKNGSFGSPHNYKIPLEITNIQSLIEENKRIKRYAFTCRQKRIVGIYSFTHSGKPILSSVCKFESYPKNISAADINNNGRDELLISGDAFNGLSIISRKGSALNAHKIVSNANFSQAVFADLNNDGYSDIVAFNTLTNSLEFYYNNSKGVFNKVRTIQEDGPISQLHAIDLNLDNYVDLLFVQGDSIHIMYGDFASSYNNQISIPTKYYPDKIIIGDFNNDGKMDIAYVNYEAGILSVLFGKSSSSFYPEMIYLLKGGLKDIIPFYSKFVTGIACINSKGKIYTVSNLSSISDSVNITTGAKPTAISYFDAGNDGINDICYIDSFTTTLNLIVRNSAGIPRYFYSYDLSDNHTKILVDDTESEIKTFFCYSPGKKLIEIVKINFAVNKIEKLSVYAPGKIKDLKIKNTGNKFDNIYLAYTKNDELGFGLMEYRNFRYLVTNYPDIAFNPLGTSITLKNYPGIIYWQDKGNQAQLYRITFNNGQNISKPIYDFTQSKISTAISFTGNLLNNDNDATISFIDAGKKNFAVFTNYSSTYLIKKSAIPIYNKGKNIKLFFGETKINGLKRLLVYVPSKKIIDKLDFINKGKNLLASKLAGVDNVWDFFVKNLNFRNYHLVYSNSENDCITIKQL